MDANVTTVAIQGYLSELRRADAGTSADRVVRDLLGRSASRLQVLSARMLHGGFPRLARPPLNVQADEMLSAVVERLMKALREARPNDARQFFALANQHLRWELMDLARRLDAQEPAVELHDGAAFARQDASDAGLSVGAHRILAAIEALRDEDREVFDLVRVQDLSHAEAAAVLGVSTKTVQRRLARCLRLLGESLADLAPSQRSARAP